MYFIFRVSLVSSLLLRNDVLLLHGFVRLYHVTLQATILGFLSRGIFRHEVEPLMERKSGIGLWIMHSCHKDVRKFVGKSTRIPLDVCLFTRMPLKVPNLPIYPYVQKNTLYKVNIHSNVQAIFTKLPFKQKILYLVIIWVVFLSFLVHIQASLYVCLVICSNNGAYAPFKISSYGPITMRLCGEHGWSHL